MSTQDIPVLGAQRFLRGMPDAHLARLAAACRHVAIGAGQQLCHEGETASRFWLIDAGQVTVDVSVPGSSRVIIDILGRGDLLGLSWMLPPYQCRLRAIATQPTEAFEFDAQSVRAACDSDASLGYEFTKRLSGVIVRRLQATRTRLLDVGSRADVMA
jgi:CRP/FNR family transcriptional regulator, cyclic AMP receptor protein